jgi:hypothetical protein
VRLTVDARAVTSAIDAAIVNADTDLRITADSTSLTGSIDAAVGSTARLV